MRFVRFSLILLGLAFSGPLRADADYRPSSPQAGILAIPLLSIGGVPRFTNVQLSLDLSTQRIVSVNAGGQTTSTARVQGDYQPVSATQGILSLPVLNVNGTPVFKAVKLNLNFSTHQYQIMHYKPARPVMLGAYTGKFTGDPAVVNAEFVQLDAWAGKRLSLAGMFVDLDIADAPSSIPASLELLRQNGYTVFINLASYRSAEYILSGTMDAKLKALGQVFAAWLNAAPDRWVWIAPLPEMNGTWETYTTDAATFKRAYLHIQTLFRQAGVTRGARWVFAPNGWSWPERQFELFYPGDAYVDAVGFSGYNRGYCTSFAYPRWETPEQVYGEYLARMRLMAPSKPILISQIASASDIAIGQKSEASKDAWLRDTYAYLARSEGVIGMMYFNIDKECDWAFHRANGGVKSEGYRQAVADSLYGYVPMSQMGNW